jgi:hypothetical protein
MFFSGKLEKASLNDAKDVFLLPIKFTTEDNGRGKTCANEK